MSDAFKAFYHGGSVEAQYVAVWPFVPLGKGLNRSAKCPFLPSSACNSLQPKWLLSANFEKMPIV